MLTIQEYLAYWPVLAGTLLFLILGLWMYLRTESAMERSTKPVSWVGDYRKPGFPFRTERLPWTRPCWLIPVLLALAAGVLVYLLRYNAGMIIFHRWLSYTGRTYNLLSALIAAAGAFAVYVLLLVLFQSSFSALMGTLLFLVCPIHGHNTVSFLAVSALFLVLYLRSEGVGFRVELLYLCACLFFALAAAVSPELLWLAPALAVLHWYKLSWNLRHNLMGFGKLSLFLAVGLIGWLLFGIIAALSARFMHNYFSFAHFTELLTPLRIRYACSELWASAKEQIFQPLMRNRLLEPMLDAPLLGLGFWGLFSVGGMSIKRRRVQGWFVLGMTAILGLIWLLSGCYTLTLPLTLAVGALAKNAELGEKRGALLIVVLLGVLFSIGIAVGAWALPLISPLAWRLL